jgi:DNA-directed RNA polymerase sigma subunit (sigma70/sigma32)
MMIKNSSNHNEAITTEMNLLDEKLEEFHKKLPLNILYLQHPVGDDDSLLEDFIEDSDSVPTEDQADKNELAKKSATF